MIRCLTKKSTRKIDDFSLSEGKTIKSERYFSGRLIHEVRHEDKKRDAYARGFKVSGVFEEGKHTDFSGFNWEGLFGILGFNRRHAF